MAEFSIETVIVNSFCHLIPVETLVRLKREAAFWANKSLLHHASDILLMTSTTNHALLMVYTSDARDLLYPYVTSSSIGNWLILGYVCRLLYRPQRHTMDCQSYQLLIPIVGRASLC